MTHMNKYPILHALSATAYISFLVLALNYSSRLFPSGDNSVLAPIAFLSLFVLSVALTGYFFVYQPVQLMIEGRAKEAVRFFLLTVAYFAGATAVVLFGMFLLQWLY